jgi:hypothetical protein
VVDYALVDADWAGAASCRLFYWHPMIQPILAKPGFLQRARAFLGGAKR